MLCSIGKFQMTKLTLKTVVWDKLQLLKSKGNKAETNFKTSTILLIFR